MDRIHIESWNHNVRGYLRWGITLGLPRCGMSVLCKLRTEEAVLDGFLAGAIGNDRDKGPRPGSGLFFSGIPKTVHSHQYEFWRCYGWAKSISRHEMKPWLKPLFAGIYRGFNILEFLRGAGIRPFTVWMLMCHSYIRS